MLVPRNLVGDVGNELGEERSLENFVAEFARQWE